MSDTGEPRVPASRDSLLERLYAGLAEEEDARSCRDIPEEACRVVPGNFAKQVGAQVLTSLGDEIVNPKTVLPWLMGAVGAPAALVGLLVPVRESGSLVPQLFIAARVRRLAHRKGVWLLGAAVQAAAAFGMAAAALWMEGVAAGLALVGALAVFALARGLCSVASKDVLGKTVPKGRRGRLSGIATTAAGLGTLALGAGLALFLKEEDGGAPFALLLLGAAGLWTAAALVFARVEEPAGETDGGANGGLEALARLSLLLEDAVLRRFVIARALLLSSALAGPYLLLLAREQNQGSAGGLGSFVIASAIAASLSAPLWGRFADRSSRLVLVFAAGVASLVGFAAFAIAALPLAPLRALAASGWIWPAAFFLLAVAHAGVRLGRKTYLVDMAGGNRRTEYVAVSNTCIGLLLLALGGASAALSTVAGPAQILLLFSGLAAAGALTSLSMPEVQGRGDSPK